MMAKLISKQEDLIPELAEHLATDSKFNVLHHPLVINVLHTPEMNALVNAQYRHKVERVERAIAKQDIQSYVALHERPYRVSAMMKAAYVLELTKHAADYWHTLKFVLVDTENQWQHRSELLQLLTAPPNSDWLWSRDRNLMSADERAAAIKIRIRQTVLWRGVDTQHPDVEFGLSWTTDLSKAEWFAARWVGLADGVRPAILRGESDSDGVIGCLNGRGESEVIVDPSKLLKWSVIPGKG